MSFTIEEKAGKWHVTGALNEYAHFGVLLGRSASLDVDLSAVTAVNSLGIMIFCRFFHESAGTELHFHACSPVMVELFNAIPASLGVPPRPERVHSILAPYSCPSGHRLLDLVAVAGGAATLPAQLPCTRCKRKATLEVDADEYLEFLRPS